MSVTDTLALRSQPLVQRYLDEVRTQLSHLPPDVRDECLAQASAEIELELGVRYADPSDADAVQSVLAHLGTPQETAARIEARHREAAPRSSAETLARCRACAELVSTQARTCPHCGAPHPAQADWNGTGYEWRSRATYHGWPLLHIAWGRDRNGRLRVARGVVAIGQFGLGAVTVAQFGVGLVFGLGQFVLAPIAVGQLACGLVAAGQVAIGLLAGAGQFATGIFAAGMKAVGTVRRSLL